MRAIRVNHLGDPEVLLLQDVPVPAVGAGQVLVRIHSAGVNPVDTYIRSGQYGQVALPYTPGMDGSGVVAQVGSGVAHLKKDQRVYCAGSISGTYAEYALCRQDQVYPIPDFISYAQGAAVFVSYATAYRALFQRAKALAGQTVLIHGASGGVGSAALQLASAAGLRVIGTAGTQAGLDLVKSLGAWQVLDHRQAGYLQMVMDITQNRGVDLVLEMLANVNLNNDLSLLAFGGSVVVIGSRGKIEIDPRLTMSKDAAILGMSLLTVNAEDSVRIHAALVSGLEKKVIVPVIGKQFKLEDAVQAHVAVMQSGACGKVILNV